MLGIYQLEDHHVHRTKLFQNGRSQAVRIPKSLAFEGVTEVTLRREGEKLIVEPSRKSWLTMSRAQPGDDDFMAERPDFMETERVEFE